MVVVVIGEGGSGGALAMAVGDRVLMLEKLDLFGHLSGGLRGDLWGGQGQRRGRRKLAAHGARSRGPRGHRRVVDEPTGGAHRDPPAMAADAARDARGRDRSLATVETGTLLENRFRSSCTWACSRMRRRPEAAPGGALTDSAAPLSIMMTAPEVGLLQPSCSKSLPRHNERDPSSGRHGRLPAVRTLQVEVSRARGHPDHADRGSDPRHSKNGPDGATRALERRLKSDLPEGEARNASPRRPGGAARVRSFLVSRRARMPRRRERDRARHTARGRTITGAHPRVDSHVSADDTGSSSSCGPGTASRCGRVRAWAGFATAGEAGCRSGSSRR